MLETYKNYPKISIVTPSYNQGQFIEETILSIINQNYPNLEYIIIDGGSTDNTVEIIKKYENFISYWISEKDNGQTEAIIKGLHKCTGELFNWINSDDMLAQNALWNIANSYVENRKDIITGITINVDSLGNELSRYSFNENRSFEEILFLVNVNQPGSFWKTKIVKELGLNPNLRYVMDLDLMLRYLFTYKNIQLTKLNQPIAFYRYHINSKTVNETFHFDLEEWALYTHYFKEAIVENSFLTLFNDKIKFLNFDFNKAKYFPKFQISKKKQSRYFFLLQTKLLTYNCFFFNIFKGLGKNTGFAVLELKALLKNNKEKSLNILIQESILKLFQRDKLINVKILFWSIFINYDFSIWLAFIKTCIRNTLWKIRKYRF